MGTVNGDIVGLLKRLAEENGVNPYGISRSLRLNPTTVREWFVGKRPIPERHLAKLAGEVSANKKQYQEFIETWQMRFRFDGSQISRQRAAKRISDRFTVSIWVESYPKKRSALNGLTIAVQVYEKGTEEEGRPIYEVTDHGGFKIRQHLVDADGSVLSSYDPEKEFSTARKIFDMKVDLLKEYCDDNSIIPSGLLELGYQYAFSSPFFDSNFHIRSGCVIIPNRQVQRGRRMLKRAVALNSHSYLKNATKIFLGNDFFKSELLAGNVQESRQLILDEFIRIIDDVS